MLEIVCGLLLVVELFSRLAAIPLLIIMVVAFITTKLLELIEKSLWVMLHDYRTDFALTLTLIVVLLIGAGDWSLENRISKN
jgi:putative oxidoreductase